MMQLNRRLLSRMSSIPLFRRKLDSLCVNYREIRENLNYDPTTNGELWLLKALAERSRLSTVFDVGANQGDWASLALELNPNAAVHCFEICPPTYDKLSHRFASDHSVSLNPVGLSDSPGENQVKYCPDADGLSSIFEVVCPTNVEFSK